MSGFITGRTSLTKVNTGDIVDDAVTLAKMAALVDGEMIVGDGTSDPVAESGGTLRTSIGVGTGDNVQVTNLTATGAFTSLGIDDNATTNALVISSDEEITTPLQPMFSVYNSAALSNVTGDGTGYNYVTDTEDYDRGGNCVSGVFTAPISGIYRFTAQLFLDDVTSGAGHADAFIDIVTSNRTYEFREGDPASRTYPGDRFTISINLSTYMDAADTAFVRLTVTGGTKVVDINGGGGESFFHGELIG